MSEASKSRRAREVRPAGLDTPLESKPRWYRRYRPNPEAFGVVSEGIARWMGTPQFLVWMTAFVIVWITLNLIGSSIHLANAGGQVIVSTALSDFGEVMLRVRDTGQSLNDNEVAAALEPFRCEATGTTTGRMAARGRRR